jgi:hypothetical protein
MAMPNNHRIWLEIEVGDLENGWRKFLRFLWAFVIIAGLIFGILLAVILKLLGIEPDALWLLIVGAISAVCAGILANLRPVVDFFNRPFVSKSSSTKPTTIPNSSIGERTVSVMDSIQSGFPGYNADALRRKVAPRMSLDDVRGWCFVMAVHEPRLSYDQLDSGGVDAKVRQVITTASNLNQRKLLIEALQKERSDILASDYGNWLRWAEQEDSKG